MKKRYQIDQQRAVQQFRRLATEQNPNIQMILPMADIVGLLQEGVGNLLRHAGLELMHLVMDEEVKSLGILVADVRLAQSARGYKVLMSRLSWKWRERSAVKLTERTHEKTTEILHRRSEGRRLD